MDEFTVQVKDFTIVPLSKGQLPRILQSTTKWTQSDDRNDTQERHHDNNDQDFIEDINRVPTSMEPESDEEIKNNLPEHTDFESEIKKLHKS